MDWLGIDPGRFGEERKPEERVSLTARRPVAQPGAPTEAVSCAGGTAWWRPRSDALRLLRGLGFILEKLGENTLE